MAISGSGTQADPWIVHNWEEFLSVKDESYTTYIKFADGGGIIDFNEIQPQGITTFLSCTPTLDGNGWVWRNMYFTGSGKLGFSMSVSNLNILNLYYTGNSNILDINDNSNNLVISGVAQSSSGINLFGRGSTGYGTISRCSCNLKVRSPAFTIGNNSRLSYEQNHFHVNAKGTGRVDLIGGSGAVRNNLFTGSLYTSNGSNCVIFPSYTGTQFNVVDMDVNYTVGTSLSSINTINLYNSDKMSYSSSISSPYVIPCTTAQLKDAAYLESIGFPVGV